MRECVCIVPDQLATACSKAAVSARAPRAGQTKKTAQTHQTLFPHRGWGLETRLAVTYAEAIANYVPERIWVGLMLGCHALAICVHLKKGKF